MSCHAVTDNISVILLLLTWWSVCNTATANLPCGFPGKPTNETLISEEKILYSDGETVEYSCPGGFAFYANGDKRTCNNGSWSRVMMFCNPNMAFGKEVRIFQNLTLLDLPKRGNVVDSNRHTCVNLPPLGKNMTGWLQISLGKVYGVRTLIFYTRNGGTRDIKISVKDTARDKTEICGSQTEKSINSRSIIHCKNAFDTRGFRGGIPGDTVIIEDVSSNDLPLEICEVYVYAYHGNTDCGMPEAPAFGSATYISSNTVQFDCQPGYTLIGPRNRTCDPDGADTHWPKANMPICKLDTASTTHNSWAIAFICTATLAVIFIAVSVFVVRKLKANGTKVESVERSSLIIEVQHEGRNDNVTFNPPCPRMESASGRNSPIYEEINVYDDIGSQEGSPNQKRKKLRGTDAIHKNIIHNACYENPKECELSCEYENLHVNDKPVYQNCSRPLESIYTNT